MPTRVIAQTVPAASTTGSIPAPTVPPSTAPAARLPAVKLPAGELDPYRLTADQVVAMARTMAEPGVEQDVRDLAARRLLMIGTNDARTALADALRDPANAPARLAAARAVADDVPPGPEFIDPLFVLIDSEASPQLMDAAAFALGRYKASPEVTIRLVALTDARRTVGVRVAAINGLAGQVDKRAAARLVQLAQEAGSPPVVTASIGALRTFTTLDYDTPAEWDGWWRTQSDLPDDRFRLETLTARLSAADRRARAGEETFQELSAAILATINQASRDQRGVVFQRYLTSPREAVRLIAIRRAYAYIADPPANLRPLMRELLADASGDVRFEAARIVQALNDADAFAALAYQSAVEPDARVRAKIADALGTIGNLDAVPLLRSMLDDGSTSVVQSAAGALAQLGPRLAQDRPREAGELAVRLQRLLTDRAAGQGVLRESVVAALVPLMQPSLMRAFTMMLSPQRQPTESPRIRALAARGLGLIGDPELASPLVGALADGAGDVRVEVVRAIGAVSRDFNNAPRLLELLDPKAEPDERVRGAAWEVIRSQLPIAPLQQLTAWPDRPLLQRDEAKRLEIFNALAQRYASGSQPDDQGFFLQQVGDSHMNLGDGAEQANDRDDADRHFAAAAQAYAQSLELAQQTGPAMRQQALMLARTRALLRSRDYAQAIDLARAVEPVYQELIGAEWKLEAERLNQRRTSDADAAALDLIAAAGRLGKALPSQHQATLNEIRASIERRQGEKNQLDGGFDAMQMICLR